MAEEFKMPPMGQTSASLTILEWQVKEGDVVKQGDVLAQVETDKATLDVESYLGGTVLRLLCEEGETVEVGTPIAIIGEVGEALPVAAAAGATAPAVAGTSKPTVAGRSTALATGAAGIPSAKANRAGAQTATFGARTPGPGKVLASPVARKLAKESGIDLKTVTGTGPGGRITKVDVAGAPLGRNRSIVARRVATSFQTIPHVYLTASVDMSVAAVQLQNARAGSATKITYTHIVLRAIGAALSRNPRMNAVWNNSGTPTPLGAVSVGLVVSGGQQLAIVSVQEPGRKSLGEIAGAVNDAVGRARAGALTNADFAPCAVSLSNLGMFAVDEFQAIIDPDQSSMVSVGRISDRVVAINGAIAVRPVMSVTVAADHRVVDGVDVAAFLEDIKRTLEG